MRRQYIDKRRTQTERSNTHTEKPGGAWEESAFFIHTLAGFFHDRRDINFLILMTMIDDIQCLDAAIKTNNNNFNRDWLETHIYEKRARNYGKNVRKTERKMGKCRDVLQIVDGISQIALIAWAVNLILIVIWLSRNTSS
jgi:hypothetical protein